MHQEIKIRFWTFKHVAKPSLWGLSAVSFWSQKAKRDAAAIVNAALSETSACARYSWEIMIELKFIKISQILQ
jgi:hypothetical protein